MRSRRSIDREIREQRRRHRRYSRPHSYSSESTDSSPSSTSVERRNSRTRSSTSALWNAFEPTPFRGQSRAMPTAGPFVGNFIHPDVHGYYSPYQYPIPSPIQHQCSHCIMLQSIRPESYGPTGPPELYDRVGYLKPANHHAHMSDDNLIYQGIAPHSASMVRNDSYHSDYREYLNRHREQSFESLPGRYHEHRGYGNVGIPPSNPPYQGYSWDGLQYRGQSRVGGLHFRNHSLSRRPLPRQPYSDGHMPYYQHHPAQLNYQQSGPLIYNIPHAPHHMDGRSQSSDYRLRYENPLNFHRQAKKYSKAKRFSSPDRERKNRNRSPKDRKMERVQVETIPVREEQLMSRPLRFQKQLTQRSNFISRQNTNLSDIASPLFNGPPPRNVFAYADPSMHGLTPNPSSRDVPRGNYRQPSWLRYDSFGDSIDLRNFNRPPHGFSGAIRHMELSPENDGVMSKPKKQKTQNQMKKQKTPSNAVAAPDSPYRSSSSSHRK